MSDPIGPLVSRLYGELAKRGAAGGGANVLGQVANALGADASSLSQGADKALSGISSAADQVSGPFGGDSNVRQVPVFPGGFNNNGQSFGDTLTRAINGVSEQQDSAASTLQAFLRGDNVEIHQVMAATEEAQISLQMLIEVRNKFTDAYRTLSSMQG